MRNYVKVVSGIFVLLLFATVSYAGSYTTYFPNGDAQINSTSASTNGYDHEQINFNFKDQTATLTVMDPDGVPQHYYYGEINPYNYVIYESVDGINWAYMGTYYR